MDQAKPPDKPSLSDQLGGVDIAAQQVSIGGDVVGRDKIVNVYQATPNLEIPLPPEPTRPPHTAGFVGRERELNYYADRLAYTRLAVITGMPGVGKTSLASALIERLGKVDLTLWHSFHKTEGISAVIWQSAGFLARQGQPDLWQMLNRWHQAGGQPPPANVLFDYLFQMLRGREYLLCFDDFQFVDDDPLLDQFIQRLEPALAAGELSLIVTSRRVPAFVQVDEFDPLAGLSAEDAYRFMLQHDLPIAQIRADGSTGDDSTALSPQLNLSLSEIAVNLYKRTEGNPLLLLLAMNGFKRSSAPAHFLARLFSDADVERFLVKEVDTQLSEDERTVMEAVAVLMGYEGTRDAIEAVLNGSSARLALNALSQRYLLTSKEEEGGRSYGAHAILRDFYYDALSKRERQAMHLRAAKFYEADEPNTLLAAIHYEAAGDPQRATHLAIDNLEALINRGQARALEQLLERLAGQSLEPALQLIAYEAHGDLHYLLGEFDEAVQRFEQASALAARAEPIIQARLQRKRGDVHYRRGENEAALKSLSLGRNLLTGATDGEAEAARLAVVDGTVLLALGRYDEAIAEAQDALDGLHRSLTTEPRVEANVRDLLGKGQFFKGNLAESLTQFRLALELRQSASDSQGILKSYSNLAVVYGQQKRYAEALQANQAAVEIAERIGDVVALGHLYNNLAADYADQGQYEQAIEYQNRSLNLHRAMGNLQELARAHHNLGNVYYRMAQFEVARQHLKQAIELARQIGNEDLSENGTLTLTEINLAQGNVEDALTQCLELLDQMARSGNQQWRPLTLQLLGQVYHALSCWDDARACFAEAKQLWQQRESWVDLSTTLLNWAKVEASAQQLTTAQKLCQEAATTATEHHVDEVLKETTHFQAQLDLMSTAKGEAS